MTMNSLLKRNRSIRTARRQTFFHLWKLTTLILNIGKPNTHRLLKLFMFATRLSFPWFIFIFSFSRDREGTFRAIIFSLFFTLNGCKSRISMKIFVAFVVTLVVGICDGQTNPLAYGREQKVKPAFDDENLPLHSRLHSWTYCFSLARIGKSLSTMCWSTPIVWCHHSRVVF